MNLTELIRAVIDQHICTCQASEDNKRLLTKAIVNVIPKKEHGEWIPLLTEKGTEIAVRCSACDNYAWQGHRSDFCPNCGADMRGKKNE